MKEALTQEGMISLIKQQARGHTVIDLLLKDGKTREEALDTVINLQIMTLDGVETRGYKVSELLEEARVLDDYQSHCEECLAGRGEPFGCLKSIHYPLSSKAEEWLVAISEKALEKGMPNSLALQYIPDNKVTGEQFKLMRADPSGTFLELKKPLEVTLSKGFMSRKTVDTDQILHVLLGFPKVQNPHQMVMLMSFADAMKVSDTKPPEDSCEMAVRYALDGGKESWRSFSLPGSPSDDHSVTELKEYLRTMFVAYVIDREIIVDL